MVGMEEDKKIKYNLRKWRGKKRRENYIDRRNEGNAYKEGKYLKKIDRMYRKVRSEWKKKEVKQRDGLKEEEKIGKKKKKKRNKKKEKIMKTKK